MKDYLVALGASLLTTTALVVATVAHSADLPKRTAPPAPVAVAPYVPVLPFYVGLTGGGAIDRTWSLGAVGGYQVNEFFRTELTYDHNFAQDGYKNTDTVMGNLIVQYPLGMGFTPYALAGAGYQWGDYSGRVTGNDAMYNVGGGIRYALTSNIELDARYRYFNSFENNRPTNVGTIGINYRF